MSRDGLAGILLLGLVVALAACAVEDAAPAATDRPSGFEAEATAAVEAATTAAMEAAATTALEAATTAAALEATSGPELDCADPAEGTIEWSACNVEAGLRSRNLAALLSYMPASFRMGPWRSEWTTAAPEEVIAELMEARLPADPSLPMTFTSDRAAFPALDGAPPESLLGPGEDVALVLFSEGWEYDGAGEALLFFTEPTPGKYEWSALLLAPAGFGE